MEASVGNFPNFQSEVQFQALKRYLNDGEKSRDILEQHATSTYDINRLIECAQSYRTSIDGSQILCEDKIVLCEDQWVEQMKAIISAAKSSDCSSFAKIEKYIKDRYFTGNKRNACQVKWIKEQIRLRDNKGASTALDLSTFLPVSETEEKSFQGTRKEVTDTIQYLANKEGFEIRRTKVSFIITSNVMRHHYRCSLYKKEFASKARVLDEANSDDSEDELVLTLDQEETADPVNVDKQEDVEQDIEESSKEMATEEGVGNLRQLLKIKGDREEMSAHGTKGKECDFKMQVDESIDANIDFCIVNFRGIHNVHDPKTEPQGCRCLHPAIEAGIHFAHSTSLSTFQVIGSLQSFAADYKAKRDKAFMRFELGTADNAAGGTVDIGNILSPMADARSFHAKSGNSKVLDEYKGGLGRLASNLLGHSAQFGQLAAKQFVDDVGRSEPQGVEDTVAKSLAEGSRSSTSSPIGVMSAMDTGDLDSGTQHQEDMGGSTVAVFGDASVDSEACHIVLPVPPESESEEDWSDYVTKLAQALSVIARQKYGSLPMKLVKNVSQMPATFSNFNWDLSHELVRRRIRQYRKEDRGGLTASDDALRYFNDLQDAGWATIYPLKGDAVVDGVLEEYGVFIQTPMQQSWVQDVPGLTSVVGSDDTFNLTAFNLPYFVGMGTDPATNMQLPVFQCFLVYKTKKQYAKARMMYWMYKTYYSLGNPEISLHNFDKDDSSFIALHMLYTERLVLKWEEFVANLVGVPECVKAVNLSEILASRAYLAEVFRDKVKIDAERIWSDHGCAPPVAGAFTQPSGPSTAQFGHQELKQHEQTEEMSQEGQVQGQQLQSGDQHHQQQQNQPEDQQHQQQQDQPEEQQQHQQQHPAEEQQQQPDVIMRSWIKPFVPDYLVPGVVALVFAEMERLAAIARIWVAKHNEDEVRLWSEWEQECSDVWYLVKAVLSPSSALHVLCIATLNKYARICIFHVLKAWVQKCKNIFANKDEWKKMFADLKSLIYAKTVVEFEAQWESMKTAWRPEQHLPITKKGSRTPGAVVIEYIESYWMKPEIITLWPMCHRHKISRLGNNTTNPNESHFYNVKYLVHGGRRPTDMRRGMNKIYGHPTASDEENRSCYYHLLDVRRKQKLAGVKTSTTGAALAFRATKVIQLLKDWVVDRSLVLCLDATRLIFKVGGQMKGGHREEYIVSLHTNGCSCLDSDITCKHVLACRQYAKTAFGLDLTTDDFELNTIFSGDELTYAASVPLMSSRTMPRELFGESHMLTASGSKRGRSSRGPSPEKTPWRHAVEELGDTIRESNVVLNKLKTCQNMEGEEQLKRNVTIKRGVEELKTGVATLQSLLTEGSSSSSLSSYKFPSYRDEKLQTALLGMSQDTSRYAAKGDVLGTSEGGGASSSSSSSSSQRLQLGTALIHKAGTDVKLRIPQLPPQERFKPLEGTVKQADDVLTTPKNKKR